MADPIETRTDPETGFVIEHRHSVFGGTFWLAIESAKSLAPMATGDTVEQAVANLIGRLERAHLRTPSVPMRRAA